MSPIELAHRLPPGCYKFIRWNTVNICNWNLATTTNYAFGLIIIFAVLVKLILVYFLARVRSCVRLNVEHSRNQQNDMDNDHQPQFSCFFPIYSTLTICEQCLLYMTTEGAHILSRFKHHNFSLVCIYYSVRYYFKRTFKPNSFVYSEALTSLILWINETCNSHGETTTALIMKTNSKNLPFSHYKFNFPLWIVKPFFIASIACSCYIGTHNCSQCALIILLNAFALT